MTAIDDTELQGAIRSAQQALEQLRGLTESFVRARLEAKYDIDPGEMDTMVERVYRHVQSVLCVFDRSRARRAFSWFMTVVDHAAVDYLRRHKEIVALPVHTEDAEPEDVRASAPDVEHERRKAFDDLCSALAGLNSPRRREILLLVAFSPEMTYDKIMKIMRLSTPDAARELKYQALMELRRLLAGMGRGPDMLDSVFRQRNR